MNQNQQIPQNPSENKKKLKGWQIALIIIGCIIVIGAICSNKSSNNSNDENVQATASSAIQENSKEQSTASSKSLDAESEVESKTESKVESKVESKAESKVESTVDKQSYMSSCKEYTYKEIARNPNNYKGKKAKFNGKVIQVMESGNNIVLRVNVTKEANEFADGGYLYTDTIYVEYTYKNDNESRILNDDIIDLYGELNGTKTYSSTLGGNITIPYLLAEYINIKSE